jgi:hypothetical protein
MENIIEVAKKHPVPIGIGVVVLLVLVMSSRSSAASSGSNAGAYLQAQQIAASSNGQIAALNSQTAVALGAQSVEKMSIQEQAASIRANGAMSLFASLAGVNAQVAMNDSNNAAKTVVASFANKQAMTQLDNDYMIQQQAIGANIKMNGDKLAAAKSMLESDNNFKLAAIGATTQGDIAKIGAISEADLKSQNQQNAFTLTTMPSIFAHAESMAKITGQNAANIYTIQGKTATDIAGLQTQAARTQAQAAKNESDWGIVGNIAKTIFSFF